MYKFHFQFRSAMKNIVNIPCAQKDTDWYEILLLYIHLLLWWPVSLYRGVY